MLLFSAGKNDFKWVDGSPYTWGNWGPNEPNNGGGGDEDCVEVNYYNGLWNDLACRSQYAAYSCKAKACK